MSQNKIRCYFKRVLPSTTCVLFLVSSTSSVDCMRTLLHDFSHFSGEKIIILKTRANMSKKSPAWKKVVLDTQVRDRLSMGAINKDDSVEQARSDSGELLSRFNDEQAKRSARRIAKDCNEDGLREQSMMLVLALAAIIAVSSTAPGFGKDDDDDDDDSINLLPATAAPSKKKGHFSDEEGQADLLENSSKTSAKLPSTARLREEPTTEVKKCGAAAMLSGGTSSAQVMVGPDSSAAEEFAASCAMSDDFEDPVTWLAESFPGISCLRPLVLALKDSLRGARSNEKEKLVFHCSAALPSRAQTSLRA